MLVFFYGLFMDQSVLASKGIRPRTVATGFADGYALRIGERATLLPSQGSRAYGLVMTVGEAEMEVLYSEEGVADYVPEPLQVCLADGSRVEAACYNLPPDKIAGANQAYAKSLLALAKKLEFPEPYLAEIEVAALGGEPRS